MRVIARKTLVQYYVQHSDAKVALCEWYEKVNNAEWSNYAELKRSFNSADMVGKKRVVFNIKGNQYRLVAIVLFKMQKVFIRFIGTHEEYDRITDIGRI